jgi:hypothetical protein
VPALTMCLVGKYRSANIYLIGNWFKMIGVYTVAHPTQMVKKKPVRNSSSQQFI